MKKVLTKAIKHRRELLLALGSAVLLVAGLSMIWAASLKIPDVTSLETRRVEQSTKIYDRTGTVLLDDLSDDIARTLVPLSDISPRIQSAAIAIEDADFYSHNGIRVTSIIRAVLSNILKIVGLNDGYTQGGSTITQQVIKNTLLASGETILDKVVRKIKEWVLATKLEQVLSKEKILELYLNETPWGGRIYGVEEAAGSFFGKHAKDVTLAEAAYLAAIPQAPTYYSPYGNHRDALESRKNLVLTRMLELGLITQSEYEEARMETVVFAPQAVSGIRAPHFVFYVREQLEKEYGRDMLESSGWRVITTLDAELEAKAEEIVKARALENANNFNASNAALVAMDPKTGDILTMVGSRDYFDPEIDGAYNIALAERQPGSAFKPFVYAEAFRKGYTPETILFDAATQFSTACSPHDLSSEAPCYSPGNYDLTFRGPISIRNALAQSINVPAVQALYLVGINDAMRLAQSLGITTLRDPARYGLTLVLGGGEVSLLDMTSAYSVFAAEGVKTPPRAILRIEDRNGNVVKEYPSAPQQVLEAHIANAISDVLSDNAARAPEFGVGSALYFPGRHVAAKTGTTNDYRDAWILGYTPNIVVGSWAGNNDNTPMEKRVAGFIVAPMWHEFLDFALQKYPNTPFPAPPSLAGPNPYLNGSWLGADGSAHSILYWVDKASPTGPSPANPATDPQFPYWEAAVTRWVTQNGTPNR